MNKISYILILTFWFLGCNDSIKSEQDKYCEKLKEIAIKEIKKGNIEPVFKGKHHCSITEKYFIWKKYKINIIYPVDLHEFHQIELHDCYNSVMLENTSHKTKIISDLDSLNTKKETTEYNYPKLRLIQKYHDGKYFVGLDANNKNYAPLRIDSTYYDKLDELIIQYNSKLTDTIRCEFWYEIDTLGNVYNIEVYHHATLKIDSAVIEFYKSFKYIPANDGIKKLEFRSNDFIYFLGSKKNKNDMPTRK